MKKKRKNPCLSCGCWDSDAEGCTMPHYDRWYACPIESEKPVNQKMIEEMAEAWTNDAIKRCIEE